jgi:hypothetical protein
MTVRIHQLLAVIGGAKAETDATLARLTQVAHSEDMVSGIEKTYRLAGETEDKTRRPDPPQVKKVRYTAAQVLDDAEKLFARQWDLALTLDAAQGTAKADLVLPDGHVLLTAVPVRHLVYLEGEITRLLALVAGIPVQDGAQTWTTENAQPGQWRSVLPEQPKTKKVPFNWHRQNGSANFQEVVDVMTRDEVDQYVTTVNYTGALPAERKALLTDRLSELRTAVKMAREEANSAPVTQQAEGKKIFDWWLRP